MGQKSSYINEKYKIKNYNSFYKEDVSEGREGDNNETMVKSKRLKNYIVKNIVQPTYISDLKDNILWRYRWKKIGNLFYVISKLFTIIGAVFAFVCSYIQITYYALISGIISLLGILFMQMGDSSNKESKRKTKKINEILGTLNIDGVPELNEDDNNILNNNLNNTNNLDNNLDNNLNTNLNNNLNNTNNLDNNLNNNNILDNNLNNNNILDNNLNNNNILDNKLDNNLDNNLENITVHAININ